MTGLDRHPASPADRILRYLLLAAHVPGSGAGGGIVRYTVELATALARRTDLELHVLADADGASFFAALLPPERIHVLRSTPIVLRSLRERLGLMRVLRVGGFDVVHGTKHLLPKGTSGATRVLTVHDMLLLDRPGDFGLLKRLLLRHPYLASLREADALLAVSRATRARLVDYLPRAAERTTVVPLAPSNALLAATPVPVAALLNRRFALVVGDASARKNLALAVRTWSKVRTHAPDAVLAVVGPKSWGAEHRGGAVWDRLVREGAIVPLGHLRDGALRWCYEQANVVLCPSLAEGFGLPVVEAAAFGTPVVTSEDPALSEAAAGQGRPTATWDEENWVTEVSAALVEPGDGARRVPGQARTWDEVAAETVRAVRGRSGAGRDDDAQQPFGDRVGLSPYAAPLQVLHVISADDEVSRRTTERLANAHRARGWKVDVATMETFGGPDRWGGLDVVVFHGWVAARLRRLCGTVATVVIADVQAPRGMAGWLVEVVLARWTNVVVVTQAGTEPFRRGSGAPLTRLQNDPADPSGADELAAVLVRARAWGREPSLSRGRTTCR